MESSGWSRDLILYGSLILNFALAVALFFRTALNKVVQDWWKERRKRRTEKQDRLHQLYKHLGSYSACHFSLMAQLILLQSARTSEEVQRMERKLEEVQEELKSINESGGLGCDRGFFKEGRVSWRRGFRGRAQDAGDAGRGDQRELRGAGRGILRRAEMKKARR